MSDARLLALKKLQYQRSDTSPFPTQVDFLKWADAVTALLSYDDMLRVSFKRHVANAKLANSLRTGDATGNINSAVGLLNQVILDLEFKQEHPRQAAQELSQRTSLQPPEKMTAKWLFEHAPVSFYVGFGSLIVGAFVVGTGFSETPLYSLIKEKVTSERTASISAPSLRPTKSEAQSAPTMAGK